MGQVAVNEVLKEIEFEIAQGVVSRRDLRQAIQAVRQFQAKMRSEVFAASGSVSDLRDVAGRQFQVNDMLIALLQELSMAVLEAQHESNRASQMLQHAVAQDLIPEAAGSDIHADSEEPPAWLPPAEIEEAMRPDALTLKMEVRAPALPIVGGLLKRVRVVLHTLARFYVSRLAQKQAAINRTYGDWLLHMTRLSQRQQAEIDALKLQLTALKSDRRGQHK